MILIAAEGVKEGDRIYNSHAFCEQAKWEKVTGMESHKIMNPNSETFDRMYIMIRTRIFDMWKARGEGIAVQRDI